MVSEEGHQTWNVDYSFLARSYDVSDGDEAEKQSEEKEKEEVIHADNVV
ncbi:MAG: hypothetical protein M3530_11400 [Thermoproteota archaeon]|nr:hypothetical protein [Thermoproteota archaeon]